MKGLPVGRGEVWHDPRQRRWLVALACLAFVPTLGLMALGRGWLSAPQYDVGLLAPVLLLAVASAIWTGRHMPGLFQRVAIGALSGTLGALAYDALCMMAQQASAFGGPVPVWVGLSSPPAGATLVGVAGAYMHHWLATAALWGMAFSLVAGKARWGYGLLYGLAIGALAVGIAWTVAPGRSWLPELTWAALGSLALGHAVFGALLGFFNEQFQPDVRAHGKIIFLRDYQARARERR